MLKKHILNLFYSLKKISFSAMSIFVKRKGVNLGGGNWQKLGWVNIDFRHGGLYRAGRYLDQTSRLPFKDGSLRYVFSSHFFEHIDDRTAGNLLNESYRVLFKNGFLRITIPDFDLVFKKYKEKDDVFFDSGSWGMSMRYGNWLDNGVAPVLENKLAYAFCGYSNKDDKGLFPEWKYIKGYYCGPPKLPVEEIRSKAEGLSIHEFGRWLLSAVPEEHYDLGHINCYDEEKLFKMLEVAGFKTFYRSQYRRSKVRELQGKSFDNRPDISLYIEAIK